MRLNIRGHRPIFSTMFRFWKRKPDMAEENAIITGMVDSKRAMVKEIRLRTGITERTLTDWDLLTALNALKGEDRPEWTEEERKKLIDELVPLLIIMHGRHGNAGMATPEQYVRGFFSKP